MYYFSHPEVNFLHNGRKFITTLDLLVQDRAANTEVRRLRTEVIVGLFSRTKIRFWFSFGWIICLRTTRWLAQPSGAMESKYGS
jgi:hypothetical protein